MSKAGNNFDACLKFQDERIQFDFDNPGEDSTADTKQNEMPWLNEEPLKTENLQVPDPDTSGEKTEQESDEYWASLMAGAAAENALSEEMDSMALAQQTLEDDGLPWN